MGKAKKNKDDSSSSGDSSDASSSPVKRDNKKKHRQSSSPSSSESAPAKKHKHSSRSIEKERKRGKSRDKSREKKRKDKQDKEKDRKRSSSKHKRNDESRKSKKHKDAKEKKDHKERKRSRGRDSKEWEKDREKDKVKKRERSRDREKDHKKDREKERQERERDREREAAREREKSKKPRSRSRSFERRKPAPFNRNNRRSPKGKKNGGLEFDSPPKEMKLMEENQRKSMENLELLGQMIPNLHDLQNHEILHQLQILEEVSALQAHNIDRKLYIGNIPKTINGTSMTEMLNQALNKLSINTEPGDSVVNSWISPNSHYSIIEFRTPHEAKNGLALNNISLFGAPLKVGIFRISSGSSKNGKTSSNVMNLLGITVGADHNLLNKPFRICLPSRVIVLLHIITKDQLLVQEEYEDILHDLKEMASTFGKVVNLVIPQPKEGQKDCAGMGHAFIEYSATQSAEFARREITKKLFNKKLVQACYHEESKYLQKIYEVNLGYLK